MEYYAFLHNKRKHLKLYLEQYLWNNVYKLDAATWFYRLLCVINDLESLSTRADAYMKGVGGFYCH